MNALTLVGGLFEDDFFPFSLTRSIADIRCGILTLREKWNLCLKGHSASKIPVKIPANIIPDSSSAFMLSDGDLPSFLAKSDKLLQLTDILDFNAREIRKDFQLIISERSSVSLSSTNRTTGPDIFLEEGAVVEHCYLNATDGPIYIGRNCLIMEGTMIRGPFAAGDNTVVKMGSKIYGATSVGPSCVIGGEIKNSVIFGYSNKAHDGYLGDSVIGEWCNLGAGCSNSNIKNSLGTIKRWNPLKTTFADAGMKAGLIMGDYSRAAINTTFNTGAVVGVCVHAFGNGLSPAYLPSFSWGFNNEIYDFEKAIRHIRRWKKLKDQDLEPAEITKLKSIFDQQNRLT